MKLKNPSINQQLEPIFKKVRRLDRPYNKNFGIFGNNIAVVQRLADAINRLTYVRKLKRF